MTENTVKRVSFRRRCPDLQGTRIYRLILMVGIAFWFGSLDSAKAQVPAFAWAAKIGGSLDAGGASIAVDPAGNSYVAGVFVGTATFGTTSLNSHGEEDAFLAKYDASGNLLWAKSGGGSYEDFIFGNAVDGAGNCYVAGAFDGQATFGNITLTNKVDPSGQNGFIAKYDSAGNVLWAIQISGTENNVAIGIAVDSSGNVYATGDFAGTADFGSTSLTATAGDNDIFVAKYGSDGNLIWVRQAGGTFNDTGTRIAADGAGNCYVTGIFSETAVFGTISLTSTNLFDTFLAKYSASGSVLWVKPVQRTTTHFGALDVAADAAGNCYLTGEFSGMAKFGTSLLTSAGASDIFLAKYSTSGDLVWLRQGGGTSDDESFSVVVDSNANAYVAGVFSGTATIGGTTLTSAGDYDIFVAKFDTAGSPLWAVRGGGSSRDAALDIAVDPSGNCFLTGGYTNATSIGAATFVSNGGTDGYVARLGGSVPVSPPRFIPNSLVLTPTGRFQFQISGMPAVSLILQASDNMLNWVHLHKHVSGRRSSDYGRPYGVFLQAAILSRDDDSVMLEEQPDQSNQARASVARHPHENELRNTAQGFCPRLCFLSGAT